MSLSPVQPNREAVLVVGTTPDYIDWIRREAPGSALFMTDPVLRHPAKEPCPDPREEVLCNLADYPQAEASLERHLHQWHLKLNGITCYDCESMELAALLAGHYGLPYPSLRSIGFCRDKFLSKMLWKENHLLCPEVRKVPSAEELFAFYEELAGPLVLKPLCGSGSELVFCCTSPDECRSCYDLILNKLPQGHSNRLYDPEVPVTDLVIAEEKICGMEYSCDFAIDGDSLNLIRLSRKIPMKGGPFGTTEGYILCPDLPEGMERTEFLETLRRSADSLGIIRGICMLDFIIRDREMVLLEMAPRPGGDCLPYLLRRVRHLDILLLNLDFARQSPILWEWPKDTASYLGLRLIARRAGKLNRINTVQLAEDPRVLEIGLFRTPGHVITLPPDDYDSWILGYAVARLNDGLDAEQQAAELVGKLTVEIA